MVVGVLRSGALLSFLSFTLMTRAAATHTFIFIAADDFRSAAYMGCDLIQTGVYLTDAFNQTSSVTRAKVMKSSSSISSAIFYLVHFPGKVGGVVCYVVIS